MGRCDSLVVLMSVLAGTVSCPRHHLGVSSVGTHWPTSPNRQTGVEGRQDPTPKDHEGETSHLAAT